MSAHPLRRSMPLALAALLAACGPDAEAIVTADETDTPETEAFELATRSPGDRLVIWQQNIEAMKAGTAPATRLTSAMLSYATRPDIVVLQEAWQGVLCGDYLDPAAKGDLELMNWKGSPKDATGLATACRNGNLPRPTSVLGRLGGKLWGGAANVGHRRPGSDTAGSTSRTGTAIAWDQRRLTLEDAFQYDDSNVPGCSTVLKDYKRVAVLLRDTRRTADLADDRLVAVASAHYGSACRGASNEYVAGEMVRRWGTWRGQPLSLRVLAGDFNLEPDADTANYAARRREQGPDAWYRDVIGNTDWRGGRFLDAAAVRAPTTGGDEALRCAQWTYPNVASCAAKTLCSDTCTGFGIGGRLMRLDYVFVSNRSGSLAPARILGAVTDDASAGFSDHKAVRVVVSHE